MKTGKPENIANLAQERKYQVGSGSRREVREV